MPQKLAQRTWRGIKRMTDKQFKCPTCNRISEVDTVCIHGKAKVTMKEYRVVPSTRYDTKQGRTNNSPQSYSE